MAGNLRKESTGRIVIDSERCKGCALCIWACPEGHIGLDDKDDARGIRVAHAHGDSRCTGCTLCALICPDVAIEVYRLSRRRPKS